MTTPAPSQPGNNLSPRSAQPKTPGMAIASLIFGVISVMGGLLLIIPTVLAIVFGHLSYSRIQRDKSLGGSGIALAGLILGYVSIPFGVIMIGLLAAMAIPAFQKVREASLTKAMQNDARQIGAAAQQVMIEKGSTHVVFGIDPQTGAVSGPISQYVKQVTPGTEVVDGVIEDETDTFSLRNPRCQRGQEVVFTAEGRMLHATQDAAGGGLRSP